MQRLGGMALRLVQTNSTVAIVRLMTIVRKRALFIWKRSSLRLKHSINNNARVNVHQSGLHGQQQPIIMAHQRPQYAGHFSRPYSRFRQDNSRQL